MTQFPFKTVLEHTHRSSITMIQIFWLRIYYSTISTPKKLLCKRKNTRVIIFKYLTVLIRIYPRSWRLITPNFHWYNWFRPADNMYGAYINTKSIRNLGGLYTRLSNLTCWANLPNYLSRFNIDLCHTPFHRSSEFAEKTRTLSIDLHRSQRVFIKMNASVRTCM